MVSEKPYLEIMDVAFPHIKKILDEMCKEAKELMKNISEELSSWACGVTTCNGCWQIQGHFNQILKQRQSKRLQSGPDFVG